MTPRLPVLRGELHFREVVGCSTCDRAWLHVRGEACPACQRGVLEPDEALGSATLPERVVPAHIERDALPGLFRGWLRGRWLRVPGLDVVRLTERATLTWWPLWLVDATLVGEWEGELGEPYEVVSSEEKLRGGRWHSQQVTETRLRFTPRVGAIKRRYDNAVAPALADAEAVEAALGDWPEVAAGAAPDAMPAGPIRLPDRQPADGWAVAEAELRQRAAADCQAALAAEHVRGVSLRTEAAEQQWTWMLVPVWVSWYVSGEERFAVWVHGTTGRVYGPRMASAGRAWLAAGLIECLALAVGTAAMLFGVSALAFPPMLALALVGLVVAVALGIGGLGPLWRLHRQRREAQEVATAMATPAEAAER